MCIFWKCSRVSPYSIRLGVVVSVQQSWAVSLYNYSHYFDLTLLWHSNFDSKLELATDIKILSVNILDDMLAAVGWNMLDYVHYCKNGDSMHLPNGHRLYVHDIRRVAIRTAVAMAEKGDIVVSSLLVFPI